MNRTHWKLKMNLINSRNFFLLFFYLRIQSGSNDSLGKIQMELVIRSWFNRQCNPRHSRKGGLIRQLTWTRRKFTLRPIANWPPVTSIDYNLPISPSFPSPCCSLLTIPQPSPSFQIFVVHWFDNQWNRQQHFFPI